MSTFKNMSTLGKLMITALIVVAAVFLFSIMGLLVVFAIYGIMPTEIAQGEMSNPNAVNALKVLQIFQSIGIFIVPAIVLSKMFYGNYIVSLRLNKKISIQQFFLAVALMILALPYISFLTEVNEQMKLPESLKGLEEMMRNAEDKAAQLTELFLKVNSIPALLLNIFMIAILPAIGEELFFRGLILKIFSKAFKNIHVSVIITALLFSFIHFQFYGFLPRAVLGVLLGYLFVWSGSIWLPILAHFLNNFFATVGYYLIEIGVISDKFEECSLNEQGITMAIISFMLTLILIMIIRKSEIKQGLIPKKVESEL